MSGNAFRSSLGDVRVEKSVEEMSRSPLEASVVSKDREMAVCSSYAHGNALLRAYGRESAADSMPKDKALT